MTPLEQLEVLCRNTISRLFGEGCVSSISLQRTSADFTGDFTLVVFPFLKFSKLKPEETASLIGNELLKSTDIILDFNVIKGFLNIRLQPEVWTKALIALKSDPTRVPTPPVKETILLEYSSPNTNKPLHLGHIRNILLGHSVSEILKKCKQTVIRVNLVNDRGIHICKSMLAWKKWGNGETPESSGLKGDHLVGKYYVLFDKNLKAEIKGLINKGFSEEEAEKQAPLMKEAQAMLREWEAGEKEVVNLWKTMNAWVYAGFDITYHDLGVGFEKTYFESEMYLLGKSTVSEGLEKGVFYREKDGSVWIDLTQEGLDKKLLLRSDGTSVYITQDIGTAIQRFRDFPETSKMIYTVGNEQDYHFKVLFVILSRLGYSWAGNCRHLSYGMVELPEGKMKSREGTVVDADDMISEMRKTAEEMTVELGKSDLSDPQASKILFNRIGMGALKYFILKVDPRKTMLFNPRESVDFNGNTGPFVQYSYARIQSILEKSGQKDFSFGASVSVLEPELQLLRRIFEYPDAVLTAGKNLDPSEVAKYVYELAREFNSFYHECPVLKETNSDLRNFRLTLSGVTGEIISDAMRLLGIECPGKM
jgi:arginyl-tRNA synthetase